LPTIAGPAGSSAIERRVAHGLADALAFALDVGQPPTFRSLCRLRLHIRVVLVHPREH
jgi:hypothetical protein